MATAPVDGGMRRAVSWISIARLLDLVERLMILALYVWLVARLVTSMAEGRTLINGLPLVSEGLVLVFILVRRTTDEVSHHPAEWGLAFVATCGPLLVSPSRGEALVSPAVAVFIWIFGMFLQVSAKVALGRSFGCVPAHRGLKLGGPYHLIRHPMYVGYLLSHIAFLLVNPTLINFGLYAVCDALQIPRILAEERLLRRDPAYRTYCDDVPWRAIPGIF
jgi:protein-S-isoprenylcysteine O-methyltransferase Ste14